MVSQATLLRFLFVSLSQDLPSATTACLTFAVSIIINLDLGPSEAGISMKFTMVDIGLAITAAHRPLVRFALLKQMVRRMFVQPCRLEHALTAILSDDSPPTEMEHVYHQGSGKPALVIINDSTALGIEVLLRVLHAPLFIMVQCQL